MSGVFDKFMGSYVLLERRNLEDLLQKLGQVLSRSQLKAKFFDFLDENRLIFVILSGRFKD